MDSTPIKKHVKVLSLGGTITAQVSKPMQPFYGQPSITVAKLVAELPNHPQAIEIDCEELANVISHNLTFELMLLLAQRITTLIALPHITGIIVCQGTNALEEVAYFIHLLVKTAKPIVFTGAMRPANSLGYDGLRNLYNAITIAASPNAERRGVLVTFNDAIVSARDAAKLNASRISNFSGNDFGTLGYVHDNKTYFYKIASESESASLIQDFNINKLVHFPRVMILASYLESDELLVDAAITAGAQGIVVAGMGNGYMPDKMKVALSQASQIGIPVVRCSRTGEGVVHMDENTDITYGFIPAGILSAQKARILLMLASNVEKNPCTGKTEILVKIDGIKNQIPIKFLPEELVTNDALLNEFSQTDVRAITYCAFNNAQIEKNPIGTKTFTFKIISQEIQSGKTIFVINSHSTAGEQRFSAEDLFSSNFLTEFSFDDIRNIIYTAVSEQSTQDELTPKFIILAQEIVLGKTIFIIREIDQQSELRISAMELFSSDMLKSFHFKDIKNIIYTALSEQTSQESE